MPIYYNQGIGNPGIAVDWDSSRLAAGGGSGPTRTDRLVLTCLQQRHGVALGSSLAQKAAAGGEQDLA